MKQSQDTVPRSKTIQVRVFTFFTEPYSLAGQCLPSAVTLVFKELQTVFISADWVSDQWAADACRVFPVLTQSKWTGIKDSWMWTLMGLMRPSNLPVRCDCDMRVCMCVYDWHTHIYISCVFGLMNVGTYTESRAPRLPPDRLCCTHSACAGENDRISWLCAGNKHPKL